VTSRSNNWDTFVDDKGRTVSAGRSFKLWVLTPHDNDLCEVRFAPAAVEAAEEAAKGFTFGVRVKVTAGDKSFGAYRGHGVELSAQPGKS
jgi:hypothetical protein